MTLEESIDFAAEWLPERWSLKVYVEEGYAEAHLEYLEEYDLECVAAEPFSKETSPAEQVMSLVALARTKAGLPPAKTGD